MRQSARAGAQRLHIVVGFIALILLAIAPYATAQTPPYYNNGSYTNGGAYGGGAAIAPVPWPAETDWKAYSWGTTYPDPVGDHAIKDLRSSADPSNGGTTPQNYVSVSSGCPDSTLPSIYYFYRAATNTIYFRWRVNQIANNYATGPAPGAFGSTSPWNSALWTVFFSLTGTGYRDFAAHLDGSSGGPSQPVDVLRAIWSALQSNSIDYVGDPTNIHSLSTNPTAFVNFNDPAQKLVQFSGSGTPSTVQWPNGASETIWDYGTTRSINISTNSCIEYFVDYQIPIAMLDATAFGGPKMTENTPFQFLFATANSLNNPFQKDIVWEGSFVCDATSPGPFGDAVTLAGGTIPQPIATSIKVGAPNSCAVPVTAQIMDALSVNNCQSISQLVSAQFKYWYDTNANGLPDDAGGSWINIGNVATPNATIVTANWDLTNLIQGQYLIALEIEDNRGHTTQTWRCSSINDATDLADNQTGTCRTPTTSPSVSLPLGDLSGKHIYTNAAYAGLSTGGAHPTIGVNYAKVTIGGGCGAAPPAITKTANVASVQANDPVTYTIHINNTSGTTVSVSSISDNLPPGFSYQSTNTSSPPSTLLGFGGSVTSFPGANATGTITWNVSGVTVPGNTSRDFAFTVKAGSTSGTFHNTTSVVTNVGTLSGSDTTGVNVTNATLTISKTSSTTQGGSAAYVFNRGDTVWFRSVVTNNSGASVTGATVVDPLPAGMTFVSATSSQGTCSFSSPNVTCTIGTITSPSTVTIDIQTTATTAGNKTNTATACPTGTCNAPQVSASTTYLVTGPVLTIDKNASTTTVVAPGTVSYIIEYANVGTATATNITFSDTWSGAGFAFTSASGVGVTPTCSQTGTTVTCTLSPNTLAAGATNQITLNFNVTAAVGSYTNTVSMDYGPTPTATATDDFTLNVVSNSCSTSTFYFHNTTTQVSASATNLAVGYVQMGTIGSGYSAPPAVTFSGGGSPTVNAAAGDNIVVNGGVLGIDTTGSGTTVRTGGSGYSSAPTVTIGAPGAGGTQATATAIMTSAQRIATAAPGTGAGTSIARTVGLLTEIARFYQDPPDSTAAYVIDNAAGTNATVKLGWTKTGGNKVQDTVILADFDPTTNALVQISSVSNAGLSISGQLPATATETLTFPAFTYTLPASHRLVWIVKVADSNSSSTSDFALLFDGDATTSINAVAGAAQSFGRVCMTPVRVSLTKTTDKLTFNPGIDSITYTLRYANTSSVAVPAVVISDPLPTGTVYSGVATAATTGVHVITVTNGGSNYTTAPAVTIGGPGAGATATAILTPGGAVGSIIVTNSGTGYTSAPTITIGAPNAGGTTATATATVASRTVPTTFTNGTVSWNIGTVPAGGTGTFSVTVNTSTGVTGTSLVDTATLSDAYTPSVSATATSVIARPAVLVSKRANGTNFNPGNSLTYTIDVVNTGTGIANGVVVTDTLPSLIKATGFTAPTDVVASVTVNSGGSGYATVPTVTFTPTSGGSGAAATANMSAAAVSAVVMASGGSGYNAAPTVSFSSGAATATAVLRSVSPSMPTANGATVTFNIGALPVQATATLTLTVQISSTGFSAGDTVVTNTAQVVDAYDTSARTSSASITVTATPVLALSETATPSANHVVFVDVTSGGSYATPPTVSFSGGGCSGVQATVSTNPPYIPGVSTGPYTVTGVTITNGGSGCTGNGLTGAPTVVFSSGTAAASAYVGPAPGDTITYVLTVSNNGSATATDVVVNGTIPGNTSYFSGGTFSGGLVTSSIGTLTQGSSAQLTYVVTVNSTLPYSYNSPFGVTTLTANGTATSTNAASPTPTAATLTSGASPRYTIAKSPDGGTLSYPATTLAAAASNTNVINVASSALLNIGDYVAIFNGGGYTVARITAINTTFVTLSANVTASQSANVIVTEHYTLSYANAGNAAGATVTVTDKLPANMLYAGVPTAAPVPTSAPGVGSNGTITWTIGALNSGASGNVELLAFPSTSGTYTNAATVGDGTALNTRNTSTTAQTTFGALNPSKTTSTASVAAGGVATYTISVTNPLASTTASNVQITDNLSSGFTYKSGTTTGGNPTVEPCTSGCVGYVTITNGGSGYVSAPTVTFTPVGPGSGAAATAVVTNGVVTAVVITNAGSGYTSAPSVSFSSGTATASASLGSTSSPTWIGQTIAGNGTLTLTFQADVSANTPSGDYQNQVLASSTTVPSLVFDYLGTTQEDVHVCDAAPAIHAPAALCANSTGNVASAPRDPGATFSWSISNGTITNSTVTTVDHITIGNAGTGYVQGTTTVTISGGGGSGATATATVSGGQVTAITMTNFGTGYTSTPTVTINGGNSDATAAATLGSGFVFTAGTAGTNVVINLTKTKGVCTVSSTAVSVPVNESPVVNTDISSRNVCPNANLTLSPVIGGTSPSYQWQVSINNGSTFSNLSNSGGGCTTNCVSGATTSTLTVTNVTLANDGFVYRLVATIGSCSVNTSNATLHVTCALDLEVTTNSDSPDPVTAGNNLTYTQTVSNLSTSPTSGTVTFSQNVPSNTTFVSMTPPSGWTCTTPSVGGTGAITCTTNSGVQIAGNTATSAFTLVVAVDPTAVDGSSLTDTATVAVSSPDTDSVAANNSKTTTTTVQKRIDIAVTKTSDTSVAPYGPGFVYPGNPASAQTMNWIVTMTNNGPSRATGVSLVDTLPTGFTYASNMAATVTSVGSGYATAPTVNVSGGNGTGATARAKLGGFITVINVTNGGSGYTSEPTVTISGGGATTNATATSTINGSGQVTSIVITNEGAGYTSAPTVGFTGGGGTGAAATATVLGTPGTVAQVYFDNIGTGYTTPPGLAFIGGGGAGAAVTPSICIYNSGNAVVTCTVGTLDKNATTTMTVKGIVGPDPAQITNIASPTYNETDSNTANDNGSSMVTVLAPTVVKMLAIDGVQTKSNVTLSWRTSFEQDNLGFYVYRERAGGTRERVNKNIIVGSAFFTGKKIANDAKRSYRFVDAAPSAGEFVQYWIEDVDLKGVHTLHGPITPKLSNATTPGGGATTDPDPTAGSVGGVFTTAPGMGVTAPAPSAPAAQRLAQQWIIAGDAGAKLIVTQPGWYKVSKSDLLAAGFDPGSVGRAISVFADGIEVPIVVPDGNFGNNDTIEFYGTGIDTPSAGGHVYYVRKNIGNALRVKSANGKPGSGAPAPASTPFTFSRTERSLYFAALTTNGERDNWYGAVVTTYPVTNALTVANLDAGGGNASLNVVLQGGTDAFNHSVALDLNGHDLGVVRYKNHERSASTLSVPANWLVNGENTLTFTSTGGDDDISVVESVAITYPHKFTADGNALQFNVAGATSVTVAGFTTANVRAVDLTDPQAPRFLPVSVAAAADGSKSVSFATDGAGTRTIFAFGDDRVQPPAQIVVNAPSTLNASKNAADMVIITNKAFTNAAATLKTARDAQGISTAIVDVQNVYDEFSYGQHGPDAIRAFLQRAATSWAKAPHYVVLLGHASADPRDYLGFGSTDFVPTKLVPTSIIKTASDDWFADFNNTGLATMAIGRIPVRTAAEADTVVAKIIKHGSLPQDAWTKNVQLVADRTTLGVSFNREADELATLVPAPLTTDRVSFSDPGDPSAAVTNAFNRGALLMNYVGHGSVEVWSNYVLTSAAAEALANGDKLPFVVTMNCLNGYFHDPYVESIAEALMKNPAGGAFSVWASSALSTPSEQLRADLELFRQLLGGTRPSIGDAVLKAKQATTDPDVRRAWILFGDPSIKLQP